jgi:hypothetical protein
MRTVGVTAGIAVRADHPLPLHALAHRMAPLAQSGGGLAHRGGVAPDATASERAGLWAYCGGRPNVHTSAINHKLIHAGAISLNILMSTREVSPLAPECAILTK